MTQGRSWIVIALLAWATPAAAQGSASDGEWAMPARDYAATRYSPLRDITAAKGWVASITASIPSASRKRASPATPPKPPMRVGIGRGRGSLVRPARDRSGLTSDRPASRAARR